MKLRNPRSRFDLKIKSRDVVLEVGGGHNPHPKADVIVDKYVEDNEHRGGDLKVLSHQLFIEADGENLPFEDNQFDYVICCHVLEHVEDPFQFLKEISRVGKRGYIEVPSLIGEFLIPKNAHKWVSLEIDNKLVLTDKKKIDMHNQKHDFGDLFLYHLNSQSIAFKTLMKTHPDLFTVRIEWENEIDLVVNPTSEKDQKYFNNPWESQMIQNQFPEQPTWKEAINFFISLGIVAGTFILSLLKNRTKKHQHQIGLQYQSNEAINQKAMPQNL